MHSNEFNMNLSLVKNLINNQFPEFSSLEISPVNSVGTVNYIYRLGKNFYIRLPRTKNWVNIKKEWKWLSYLAPHLTLKIPEPIALGQPTDSYPVNWAIYKWINGNNYSDELIDDEREAAKNLANFVNELHSIDKLDAAPKAGRAPLNELNQKTLKAIDSINGLLDRDRVLLI